MAFRWAAAVAAAATLCGVATADGVKCPGSSAFVHASTQVIVKTAGTCHDVRQEIEARVAGQPDKWHDPHNNGVYAILSRGADEVQLSRTTRNGQYTDKLALTFVDGDGCEVRGCSESQVFSVADFSTNYCNLRMLYCGSADGCRPVAHDFTHRETMVKTSIGAGKDPEKCIVSGAKQLNI